MKNHYYSWKEVEDMSMNIVTQMYQDDWKPDYIVGITGSGSIPATIISNIINVRCESLSVNLPDDSSCESNLWMAEEAFGLNNPEETGITGARWDIGLRKNILIVDNINNTGNIFNWIKKDWESGCFPNQDSWSTVWGNNVRFATLTDNSASEFGEVTYTSHLLTDEEKIVVYPWEYTRKKMGRIRENIS